MTKSIEVGEIPGPEINTEKVAQIILMARELEAPDAGVDADASNPVDDNFTSSLTTKGANTALRDLLGAIEALDEDEQIELVALAWVGRGDYDTDSWKDAVTAAQERRSDGDTGRYLSGMELLAEHLDDGLAAFGRSYTQDDVEPKREADRSDGTA